MPCDAGRNRDRLRWQGAFPGIEPFLVAVKLYFLRPESPLEGSFESTGEDATERISR